MIGLLDGPVLHRDWPPSSAPAAGYFGGWVDRIAHVDRRPAAGPPVVPDHRHPRRPQFQGKTWLLFVVLLAAFSLDDHRPDRAGPDAVACGSGSSCRRPGSWACRSRKIIFRHLLPNMSSFLIIDATLNVGGAILAEAGLSLLRLRRAAARRVARAR